MKFLQFFFGILIAQITLYALWLINGDSSGTEALLRIGVPAMIIALVIALWFASIARAQSKEVESRVKERFADEREKIDYHHTGQAPLTLRERDEVRCA